MPCCARCVSARWCVHSLQKTTVKRDILEFSGLPSADVRHCFGCIHCCLSYIYWLHVASCILDVRQGLPTRTERPRMRKLRLALLALRCDSAVVSGLVYGPLESAAVL
jgi:hypothetical protein